MIVLCFISSNAEDKAEWQQAIWRAVGERVRAKLSRKTFAEGPISRNPRITLVSLSAKPSCVEKT